MKSSNHRYCPASHRKPGWSRMFEALQIQGVFHVVSRSLRLPVLGKMRGNQVAGRVSLDTWQRNPAAWMPGPERLAHPCEVQSEGKEGSHAESVSPPQACNLLGSSHLISRSWFVR